MNNSVISTPVRFNPLKHHLGFLCRELSGLTIASDDDRLRLFESVKSINANFVDVYTGRLPVPEILSQITIELRRRNIGDVTGFQNWLMPTGYQMLSLSDHSVWVLRKSEDPEAFVHVHPSRKPPLAVRVHGNAWRTVVGLLIMYTEYLKEVPGLEQINAFRKGYLGLSPVKGRENLQRVMKVRNMINLRFEVDT